MKVQCRPARAAHGSVLVLALLVSLILLGLGLTALWLSSSGGKVSTNVSRRGEAYFAAEAGLARSWTLLHSNPGAWDTALAGCTGGGAWDAAKHEDAVKGRVLCAANVPLYRVKLLEPGSDSETKASAMRTVEYTVWIRNDDEEGGVNNLTDNNSRVIVRSEATARNRLGFVALERIMGVGGGGALAEAAYSQAGMGPTGSNSGKAALGP